MNFNNDNYTFDKLRCDLNYMENNYGIKPYSIGKTVLGNDILLFKVGKGPKNVFYNGTHHALEWITSSLLMKFGFCLAKNSKNNFRMDGYDINDLLSKVTFHILPRLNVDGTELVMNNIKYQKLLEKLSEFNEGYDFDKKWQSNINGVDLNHNYDADFEKGNNDKPYYTRYRGTYPESEPEVKSVCDYVRNNNFDLCIAFHSQGEVIYYDYNGKVPKNSYEIVRVFAKESGYLPDKPVDAASFGGFKDWFIDKYNKPAYTIEVGKGKNPLPFSDFESIYEKVVKIMLLGGYLA